MQAATIQRILRQYGLKADVLYPVQKGYRNESHPVRLEDGRNANLILYKREPDIIATIQRTNTIGLFLAGRGFPVRMPIESQLMKVAARDFARYACVYNYLAGTTIPWEAYTQSHIKLLGRAMAELHAALSDYREPLPYVTNEYRAIVTRMERYFADRRVNEATLSKLSLIIPDKVFVRFQHIVAFCEKLPNQQALHMDFVRSNILFSEDQEPRITGIIDFEKAAYGHPLLDVARTLAFLLVDCKYKPAEKVRKYFLNSGYQKRGNRRLDRLMVRSRGKARPLIEELVDLFLLYDFYKFLRHNPYEFLSQNEHYVRTHNLLLERGVITTTSIGSPLAESLLQ